MLFLAFHSPELLSKQEAAYRGKKKKKKRYRMLSSVPGSAAINGVMWGQVPPNRILKISKLIQM